MMWYDNKYKGVNMCGELKKERKKEKKEKRKKRKRLIIEIKREKKGILHGLSRVSLKVGSS